MAGLVKSEVDYITLNGHRLRPRLTCLCGGRATWRYDDPMGLGVTLRCDAHVDHTLLAWTRIPDPKFSRKTAPWKYRGGC